MRRKRRRTHRRTLALRREARRLSAIAACVALLSGCQQSDRVLGLGTGASSAQEQRMSQEKPVNAVPIVKRKIGDTPEVTADVMSAVRTELTVKAGGKVERIHKKRGDPVQKGELLVTLSNPDLLLQRERALLAVRSAEDAMLQARRTHNESRTATAHSLLKMEAELDRLTRLYNRARNNYDVGLATKAQVEQARSELQAQKLDYELLKQQHDASGASVSFIALEVQLRNAQLSLQQAEQALEGLEIRAAISGVLSELDLTEGLLLGPGAKAGQIMYLEKLKLKAALQEESAKYVVGKEELDYYVSGSNVKHTGRVTYVAPFVSAEAKGVELNVEVDNRDGHLKPGMKVRLQLAREEEQLVLTVPTFSVVREGDQTYVFVVSNGLAEKRKVVLGRLSEPNQEIVSGVKENETVIVTGHAQLRDQDKVRLAAADGKKQEVAR